jgi:hypothetical protein
VNVGSSYGLDFSGCKSSPEASRLDVFEVLSIEAFLDTGILGFSTSESESAVDVFELFDDITEFGDMSLPDM